MTNIFSISDIPEFSKKDRIVVVGVIGKSPYRYPNKTSPLLPAVHCEENGIECHWDERKSILYLHAVTYLDTKRLVSLASELDEDSKSTVKDADAAHWLVASGELAMESCRAIALIFHLCHIVVLSSPTPVFDLGYLQLFKAVDGYRAELIAATTEALLRSAAGGAWDTHGRPCCPRLLFHFRRAPAPLRRAPAALKRLEHSVEDQIYFILRKARIITNVCAKSLFAIPKNEEFVYMSSDADTGNARDVSSLIRGLVHLCTGTEPDPAPQRSFRQFLQSHLDLAFGEGFDDNVGKYAMSTSFFELPSASSWRAAARALAPIYLQSPPPEAQEAGGALFDALATDVRFSQARCAKVLPIAQASYAEGLPAHYSSQHHVHKVCIFS
ncbi:jg6106 [Pararge aegeria aegeria]|uniref:Nonsense-mediated mRNA decay factor SMG8 n=1 Tax=Pararge aegeria aegeria TaxID=348720 RepID=A0A8S4RE95_9NEOP|nr:jg6106 [Pararge aegeria aegeria]